jgi:hypothetical protein
VNGAPVLLHTAGKWDVLSPSLVYRVVHIVTAKRSKRHDQISKKTKRRQATMDRHVQVIVVRVKRKYSSTYGALVAFWLST